MFLIRRRYLNLKKLLVVECTVAAVHVRATKHIKEEREQRKKAICLLWYPKYCHRSKEVELNSSEADSLLFYIALQCLPG